MATELVRLVPMLAVRDLQHTIDWYTADLGFELCETVGDPPVWCYLKRDGVRLFFNQPPPSTFPADWPGHAVHPREGHPTEQIRSLHSFYMHGDNLGELQHFASTVAAHDLEGFALRR